MSRNHKIDKIVLQLSKSKFRHTLTFSTKPTFQTNQTKCPNQKTNQTKRKSPLKSKQLKQISTSFSLFRRCKLNEKQCTKTEKKSVNWLLKS